MAAKNELVGTIPANRSLTRLTYNQYNRLMLPASGIRVLGVGAAYPVRSTTTGLLLFSGTSDNIACGVYQLPHAWNEATLIRPYLYLRFPTAAAGVDTRWRFSTNMANPNGAFGRAHGAYSPTAVQTIANPNDANQLIVFAMPTVTMTALTISTVVNWRLDRLAATDGADTDTADCVLVGVGLQWGTDSFGSIQETSKT